MTVFSRFYRHRFTLLSCCSELLVLTLFAGTARWGWSVAGRPLLLGTLSQSRFLDFVPLSDPLAVLERFCAGVVPTATALLGAFLIANFYGLLGSRTFCGWICPMRLVIEVASALRSRLGIDANVIRIPRASRYVLLVASLLASFFFGSTAFEAISPQAILWRDLIFGSGLSALSVAFAVFALELGVMKDGWCGHLCPLGAFWALVGRASPRPVLTITFSEVRCTHCAECLRVCPEKQVIHFRKLSETGRIPSGECLNCGRCIEACPEKALSFHLFTRSPTQTDSSSSNY